MKKNYFLPLLVVLLILSNVTMASTIKEKLDQIKSLSVKNPTAAQSLVTEFVHTPLESYATFLWLHPNVTDKRFNDEIAQFLTRFADTSWAESIRQEWSDRLAKKQDWTVLLKNQHLLPKGNARCWVLEAMQQQQIADEDWQLEVSDAWQTDTAPSNGCKVIYDRIERSQELSIAQWQQKLDLLYFQNKYDVIANKLALLPTELQAETQQNLSLLTANPITSASNLLQRAATQTPEQQAAHARIFMRVMQRAVKQNPEASLALWQEGKAIFHLHPLVTLPFEKSIYRQLAKKQPERAKDWLTQIDPSQHDEETLMPLIQQAWRESDWGGLRTYLEWLPAQEQKNDIWQYWLARTLEASGLERQAKETYTQLATHRSFYGFMAADKLGVNYQLNGQQVSHDETLKAAQSELGQRLKGLYDAGLKDIAWKEWNFARNNGKLTLSEMPGFAQAALSWGWNTFSALSLGTPAHWNYIDLRFSMPYQALLQNKTQQHNISLAWAYGIMRRESVYSVDAKSRSGAMGLMQLMPKTAKSLEHIKNINDVYQPELNVHLGTKLLSQLKNDFGDNLVLASAAYNAGGFRVRQWLKQNPEIAIDQWIELIPFKETRDYVKAVMEYMLVFERLSTNIQQTRLSAHLGNEPATIKVVERSCDPSIEWCL
jgi:soluble lytic murein transglycosylase